MKKSVLVILLILITLAACAGKDTVPSYTPEPVPNIEDYPDISPEIPREKVPAENISKQDIDDECIELIRQYLMENVWRMQRAGAMESIFSDCQK